MGCVQIFKIMRRNQMLKIPIQFIYSCQNTAEEHSKKMDRFIKF